MLKERNKEEERGRTKLSRSVSMPRMLVFGKSAVMRPSRYMLSSSGMLQNKDAVS